MSVVKAENVSISKISLSEPKKLQGKNGVNIIFVNYDGVQSPLYVQTPKVDITWDAKYFADNENSSTGKYNVQFSLRGVGTDEPVTSFHDKMVEFDKFMIDTAYENRATWFPKLKKLTPDTIETLYTPMVKVSTDPESGEPDGKWPASFKFKIKKKDGQHDCSVYGPQKNSYNIDAEQDPDFVNLEDILKKGSTMNVILKCSMVWLINNKFGVTWYAEQVKVTEKVSTSLGKACAFIDDDDDEVVNDVVDDVVNDVVNDADNGDLDSDDETPTEVQEPEPEPKKKVVRRVKKALSP
jgi:hypothetical protein